MRLLEGFLDSLPFGFLFCSHWVGHVWSCADARWSAVGSSSTIDGHVCAYLVWGWEEGTPWFLEKLVGGPHKSAVAYVG